MIPVGLDRLLKARSKLHVVFPELFLNDAAEAGPRNILHLEVSWCLDLTRFNQADYKAL